MMQHLGLVAGEPQRDLVSLVEPEVSLDPVRHDLGVVEIETWNVAHSKYYTGPSCAVSRVANEPSAKCAQSQRNLLLVECAS